MGESVRRKRRKKRSTRRGPGAQMKVSAVSVRAVCRRQQLQVIVNQIFYVVDKVIPTQIHLLYQYDLYLLTEISCTNCSPL